MSPGPAALVIVSSECHSDAGGIFTRIFTNHLEEFAHLLDTVCQ